MSKSPALYNIFSNVWIYFGYNNLEHDHMLRKIKTIHGITKLINLDELCKFWLINIDSIGYAHEIKQQMIIDRRAKLSSVYKNIASQIDIALRNNNPESAPVVLCLYTLNPDSFECLVGSYLYYLNKRASMTLANAARALSSKVTGIEYQMTEEMKQYLYLICSSDISSQ